jgi:hypothetical protein
MLILGEGGVGKSMLIGAITETFEYYKAASLLAKCAASGVAASDIGAQTLHSLLGLMIRMPKEDDWLQRSGKSSQLKRLRNMGGKQFLILDEISMVDKLMLYQTSEIFGHVRAADGVGDAHLPFAGASVVGTGDFHQFPPVANVMGALYCDRPETDSPRARLGQEVYKQFDTVVILEDQIRVKDKTWMEMLRRLRVGNCTDEDVQEVRKLVLTNKDCKIPEFSIKPWSDAILITPRHSVRERWNEAALAKHCEETGNRRYIVNAEDRQTKTEEEILLNIRVKIAGMEDHGSGKLSDRMEIAVGMKTMITQNISTEAGIANGTRGIITNIILDPRELMTLPDDEGAIHLKYPPAMVLFKPDHGTTARFQGIDPGVVPITPSTMTFTIALDNKKKFSVKRRQLPITAGYAFTDYKSQGQTIEYVIIDIGKPPSGNISPFSIYVALSRSRGRDTIRLLRDFDDKLFTRHPSEDLRKEMLRLERLNEITKETFEMQLDVTSAN